MQKLSPSACIRIGFCLTIACLALRHTPSAYAQLLVYEGYDYDESSTFPNPTGGSLNGGMGWEAGWDTAPDPGEPASPRQRIVANGLNYTDSNGNRLQTSGRAWDVLNWFGTSRPFDVSLTGPAGAAGLLNPSGSLGKYGTSIWISMLIEGRDETGSHTASGFEFSDANLSGANRSLNMGRTFGLQLDETSSVADTSAPNEAYGFFRKRDGRISAGGAEQFEGSGVDAGSGAGNAQKVFMVLKLDFKGGFDEIAVDEFGIDGSPGGDCGITSIGCGTNVSAWLNPDLDADLDADLAGGTPGTDTGNFGNFANQVNFWEMSFTKVGPGGNANSTYDEFRIGATYADVAPIDTSTGPDGDFDLDGDVDGADFLRWQRDLGDATNLALWGDNFGAPGSLAAVSAVPEPTTMVLVGLTLAGFAVRRCR